MAKELRWGTFACLIAASFANLAFAAQPSQKARVSDISLGANGRLDGQVLDHAGKPIGNVPIVLKSEGVQPIPTTTTADGRFAYEGLSGGVYQVAAKNGANTTVRAWTQQAAPPNAQAQAVLYTEDLPNNPPMSPNGPATVPPSRPNVFKSIIAHPVLLSGAIATAVAVPVALNSQHRQPASP